MPAVKMLKIKPILKILLIIWETKNLNRNCLVTNNIEDGCTRKACLFWDLRKLTSYHLENTRLLAFVPYRVFLLWVLKVRLHYKLKEDYILETKSLIFMFMDKVFPQMKRFLITYWIFKKVLLSLINLKSWKANNLKNHNKVRKTWLWIQSLMKYMELMIKIKTAG